MKTSHLAVGLIALIVGYALGYWQKERTYTQMLVSQAKQLTRELNDKTLQKERDKALSEALNALDAELKRLESLAAPPPTQ